MTVKDADNGEVVFYCHNGDDAAWRGLKDECRRLGLLPQRQRPQGGVWRQTGCYEYVDEDGAVAYRTVRLEKEGERKRFKAQRPDGRGNWIDKLDPAAPRILYRLPDLIASPPATVVYLTEGERKADKLASWGLIATAIAFGAKGWRDAYAQQLIGRTVVILPDNDDEGRGFADRAAASIRKAGGSAFVLDLPDLPVKGDIIDWRGSPDDLRRLTVDVIGAPTVIATPLLDVLPLIDPGTWQGVPAPERVWAWDEWIPARQATYLTGAGSTGKSLLSQQLATCMALGRPFLGVETREAISIYVTCEDDADELHRRQLAICAAFNIEPRSLSGKLHLVSLAGALGNELAVFDAQGRMATTDAWARLHATVMQTGAGFVALDNVAHLFAGNENIRNQVAAFCNLLNHLAADANASVLFIGHPNKAGDSFSGSTAWENQVRSRIFLDRPQDGEDGPIDPDARQLSRVKANYARVGEALPFRWHRWAFVQEADLPPGLHAEIAATAQANTDNERFLKCLAKTVEEKRTTSPNKAASNYAPRLFAAMPNGSGTSERGFELAMQRLLHLGTIVNDQPVFKRANRTWAMGLGVAQTPAQTPAQTDAQRCIKHGATGGENCTAAHTPAGPYTTYKEAGSAPTAPVVDAPHDEAGWSPAASFDEDDYDWELPA